MRHSSFPPRQPPHRRPLLTADAHRRAGLKAGIGNLGKMVGSNVAGLAKFGGNLVGNALGVGDVRILETDSKIRFHSHAKVFAGLWAVQLTDRCRRADLRGR